MSTPHGTISTASHVQRLGREVKDEKLAMALTWMSVALIGIMLVKELKATFGHDVDEHHRRKEKEKQQSGWQRG